MSTLAGADLVTFRETTQQVLAAGVSVHKVPIAIHAASICITERSDLVSVVQIVPDQIP